MNYKDISEFINAHMEADPLELLFKKSPFPDWPMAEIVQQIQGRKTARKKFPFLMRDGILFPKTLNLEQSSSQATAQYKSSLISGESLLDLTAGFGIDAYFLSQNFARTTLVEQDKNLLRIVEHNWQILGKTATFKNENLEDFLSKNFSRFDWIFLDPARRDANQKKVFLLKDLTPNLLDIQNKLFETSEKILVKLSPLMDISALVSSLENITEIHIVAVKNDVKEILVLIDKGSSKCAPLLKCVNLESDEPIFSFSFDEEKAALPQYGEPEEFLYIPNNAVLKSGAFNFISQKFLLKKLYPNTHLYTSGKKIQDFPGRVLRVEIVKSSDIKKSSMFNIISKNYPLKPDEIKKKYKIIDGGDAYLIFTQASSGKFILKSL